MATNKLRFCALVRVSGETQAKHGESLRTQHDQIAKAVENMGGIVTKWFEGQEHATPGYERKKLEELLRDAAKPKRVFDAVIVADPTRWSRDNEKSGSALDHLRTNGIRFFVLSQESNLFDPVHRYMLQQFASFSELSAALNLQKAIENRIARAKRNHPTNGSLPWGRTFDKRTETWGIDANKQCLIKSIAERYLKGESLKSIAKEQGMDHSGLHENLTQRMGTVWPLRFRSPRLNIDETIELTIPALLPPKTIAAIQKRKEANKTTTHKSIKHKYLLSRVVFCSVCGSSLSGAIKSRDGHRLYRHFGSTNCLCGTIRADELEESVMRKLFECFGNPIALQRAMEAGTPNNDKMEADRKRLRAISEDLIKIANGRDRILGLIVKGTITESQAAKQLGELNDREAKFKTELERLSIYLDTAPTKEQIKAIADKVSSNFGRKPSAARRRAVVAGIDHAYHAMSWEDKRLLVETVFNGVDETGKRLGVYLDPYKGDAKHLPKNWRYRIKGHLIKELGTTFAVEHMDEPTGNSLQGVKGVIQLVQTRLDR